MIRVSLFPSVTITAGREIDCEWHDFATGYLNKHVPQLSKDGELYAGAVYDSGHIDRGDANVIGRTAVVFDIDNKGIAPASMTRPEDHVDNLAGITYAWHSTFSSITEHPRFRLVIPLSRMVTPAEWPAVYRGALALIGNDPAVDGGSADLSRAYYRPSYHPSNKGQEFAGFAEGDRLDADAMLEAGGEINVLPFARAPAPVLPTVPARPVRYDGRNDALKAQVAAGLAAGKSVELIVTEILDYDRRRHHPPLFSDPEENRGNPDVGANALRFVDSIAGSINSKRAAAGLPPEAPGGSPGEPAPFPTIWWADRGVTLDTHDFVEDLLNDGTMSVIYGDSNVGKSFFMLDLCLHVAMGLPWQGREVEQGGVIYVAAEGGFLFQNRLEAFAQHYNVTDTDIPFAIIPCGVDLRSPAADTDRLISLINETKQQINMPVRLVVIDTLNRAMNGGNENSSEDMGALVINSDRVRHETGTHLGYIHHCGKDAAKGARGHSSLRAATDTEIEIIKSEGVMSVTAVKQRDMEGGPVMDFTLKSIELGKNRRGKPVTSCVILPAATLGVKPNKKGAGKKQLEAIDILSGMFDEREAEMVKRGLEASAAKVDLKEFHNELASLGLLGADPGFYKQEFYRIRKGLLDRALILLEGGFVVINGRRTR